MIYEKQLSEKIIGCAFEVYNTLGSGFLEKIYEKAMEIELKGNGIEVLTQYPISVSYKGKIIGDYVADMVVKNSIILELKCCAKITDQNIAQLIHYLTATGYKIGYVINFGNKTKLEFKRMVK